MYLTTLQRSLLYKRIQLIVSHAQLWMNISPLAKAPEEDDDDEMQKK